MRTPSTARRLAATVGAATLVAALAAPAAAVADCEPLVTHTPTGSRGDTRAVAITSQTLSADVAGWERVGWEAADRTTLTAIAVVREDGTEHRSDGDLASGTAEQVLELRFCGSTDGGDAEGDAGAEGDPDAGQADAEPAPAAAAEDPDTEGSSADAEPQARVVRTSASPDADAPTTPADSGTAGSGTADTGTAGTDGGDAEPDPAATGEPTPQPEPVAAEQDATATAAGEAAPARGADDAHRSEQPTGGAGPDDEHAPALALATESRDPAPLVGGGLLGLLVGGGLLGLLAGAMVLVGAHRRQREARR